MRDIKRNENRVKSRFCTHIFRLFTWWFSVSGLNVNIGQCRTRSNYTCYSPENGLQSLNYYCFILYPDKEKCEKRSAKCRQPWSSFISHLLFNLFLLLNFPSISTNAIFRDFRWWWNFISFILDLLFVWNILFHSQ